MQAVPTGGHEWNREQGSHRPGAPRAEEPEV
jgi:hypothetical protein